ncbi:MAG: GDP-L-fucose synthase [Desulfobacterales bacterium]|uniref:GDP-L-fucose synthase n=1 Tax=Candidatus Desulfatibia profunda TaxID=2841695 RepID=A0A8J6NMK2_9BACT|nr:GDP-L-fucose synthase [Candidatus Desulfatibia profunda]MBL7179342.1 GDP-L-fucose synthase [Desulfobacterales bacterium]
MTGHQINTSAVLNPRSAIYVAGHRGMVGSAIVSRLKTSGYTNIVTRTHQELDLIDQRAVQGFFQNHSIDCVVLAAAKVGGIHANNTYPADFIYQNLMIGANVICEAYRSGVKQLLFLGSSCIYPKLAPQPLKEEYLLTGKLEPTNEPYAIAKIAGIKLCESFNRQYGTRFYAVMPNNLFGPNDNFDLETSHVLPALIRKFHLAKLAGQGDWDGIAKDEFRFGAIPDDFMACLGAISRANGYDSKHSDPTVKLPPAVKLWGSGSPRREFIHVDDAADACLYIMRRQDTIFDALFADESVPLLNIGCGRDLSIRDLANLVAEIAGYHGDVIWDRSKPDGTPRKLLDVSKLEHLGWKPVISLTEGIKQTYEWYLTQQ